MSVMDLIRRRHAAVASFAESDVERVKQLNDSMAAYLAKSTETADDATMSVSCTITTQSEDRAKDIVVTAGIDTANHRANPVVLLNHGFFDFTLPIGKAEDPNGNYTVVMGEGFAKATTFFSQSMLEAEQAYQLIKEGILRGVSIGFNPKAMEYRRDQAADEYNGWPGLLVKRCELIEYSHVPVPCNPQALVDRLGDGTKSLLCGKPIAAPILKSLLPFLPAPVAKVVGGFDSSRNPMSTPIAAPPEPTPAPTPAPAPSRKGDDYVDLNPVEKPDEETKDWPPGAVALLGVFDRLMELGEFIGESYKRQENPAVTEILSELAEECDTKAEMIVGKWADLYSDLPALTLSGDFDADDEEAEKAIPSIHRLTKRVKRYQDAIADRRKQAGQVSGAKSVCQKTVAYLKALAEQAADPTQKAAFESYATALAGVVAGQTDGDGDEIKALRQKNRQLGEMVKTLEENHAKLIREFRKARQGR